MLEDRFEAIVDAAQALFSARGYAATGMRDIAQRAGMAPVQVYRLGLSKEDLLAEVSARLTTHQLRHITARAKPRPGETPADFIERYLLALYRSDIRHISIRRETAAYGWMWSRRHEQRIMEQVTGLLAPIDRALRRQGLADTRAHCLAIWSLYYVGYRQAVVWGANAQACLDGIRPSLRVLLAWSQSKKCGEGG